ncbi:MAG: hypothetical protein KDG53_15390 [Rhodocyclaceae bacterium]|nr:hypothetical protein [Rhodocyclaceae bacterium]
MPTGTVQACRGTGVVRQGEAIAVAWLLAAAAAAAIVAASFGIYVAGTERNILMVLLPNDRDAGSTRHALTRMFPLPGSTGAEADLVNRVPGRRRFVNAVNLALDRGRQSWRRAGEWRTSNTSENASVCSKRRTGFTFIRFVSNDGLLANKGFIARVARGSIYGVA